MQALEEERGATFESLLQEDMIKQALAMDRQQKAEAGNDEGDGLGDDDNDADDDAMHDKARLLLVRALEEEDKAVQGDDEGKKKRKKPAGTYRWRYDFETRRLVK